MIVEGTPLLSAHRAVTVLLILVVTSASQAVFHDDAGDLNANVPNFGHISLSSEIDDFNMTVNPQSLAMHPSSSATSTVEVRSLGSFSGPVSFIVAPPPASPPVPSTASPSYLATTGFSASMRQFLLDVPPGGYATSILTISANASTPFGTYKIILFGYSERGGLVYQRGGRESRSIGRHSYHCNYSSVSVYRRFISRTGRCTECQRLGGDSCCPLRNYSQKEPSL